MAVATGTTSYVGLSLSCGLVGVGAGLVLVPTVVGVQEAVTWDRRGVATSTLLFTQKLGGALGVVGFGALVNAVLVARIAALPPDLAGQLPASLGEIDERLRAGHDPALRAFLLEGLEHAAQYVFGGIALLGLIALLLTLVLSHRGEAPRSTESKQQAASSSNGRHRTGRRQPVTG